MSKPEVTYKHPHDLRNHVLNIELYGEKSDPEFVESIREKGVDTPILVAKDGVTVISGHRRRQAACIAGLTQVPIIITQYDDDLDIREALVRCNKQRPKSNEQLAREFAELKRIESVRAAARMQETQFGSDEAPEFEAASDEAPDFEPVDSTPATAGTNLPQPEKKTGRAAEIAAETLGVSPTTMKKAERVVSAIDKLQAEGKTEKAEQLRGDLNKSVDKAFKQVHTPEPKEAKPTSQKSSQKQTRVLLDKALATVKQLVKQLDEAQRMHGGESVHSRTAGSKLDDLKGAIIDWKEDV